MRKSGASRRGAVALILIFGLAPGASSEVADNRPLPQLYVCNDDTLLRCVPVQTQDANENGRIEAAEAGDGLANAQVKLLQGVGDPTLSANHQILLSEGLKLDPARKPDFVEVGLVKAGWPWGVRGVNSGRALLALADVDKDGAISQEEYNASNEQRFKALDANSNGKLETDELLNGATE